MYQTEVIPKDSKRKKKKKGRAPTTKYKPKETASHDQNPKWGPITAMDTKQKQLSIWITVSKGYGLWASYSISLAFSSLLCKNGDNASFASSYHTAATHLTVYVSTLRAGPAVLFTIDPQP